MEINQFCPIQSFVFAVSKNTLSSGKLNEGVSGQLPFSGLLAKWCRTDLGGCSISWQVKGIHYFALVGAPAK